MKKSSDKANRKEFVQLRVSKEEKTLLLKQAQKNGFDNISEYLRVTGLNKKFIPKSDQDTVDQIRKIGININQITHSLNINFDPIFADDKLKILDSYMFVLKSIIDKIR